MAKKNDQALTGAGVVPEGGLTLAHGQILELETWDRPDGLLYRARVTDPETDQLVFSITIDTGYLPVLAEVVGRLVAHREAATRACSTMADAFDELEDMGLVARK